MGLMLKSINSASLWACSFTNTKSSHQRCSIKKVFLEISQNSQKNTCARVSVLIKLQAGLQQVHSCKNCEIDKNILGHLQWLLLSLQNHFSHKRALTQMNDSFFMSSRRVPQTATATKAHASAIMIINAELSGTQVTTCFFFNHPKYFCKTVYHTRMSSYKHNSAAN